MYRGHIENGNCIVLTPDGEELPLRLDLGNHSPTGFAWGYMGSGPTQLAKALLAHVGASKTEIQAFNFAFKQEVISGLPADDEWVLEKDSIMEWLEGKRG